MATVQSSSTAARSANSTRRAVVIGGSMAGLCAAKALREQFDVVTVLERDEIPEKPQGRRGTPQAWHNHFLLQAGSNALSDLFPGFRDRFVERGGVEMDPAWDAATCFTSGWVPRSRSRMRMLFASRPHLEATVRSLLVEDEGIDYRQGTRVLGLRYDDPDRAQRVTGVTIQGADGPSDLEADLVVDAAGRGSRAAHWMGEIGRQVETRSLDARVSYTSRWYRWPEAQEERPWWRQVTVFPDADPSAPNEHQYLCSIFPIEDDGFIAVMGSWGLPMPTDNAAFEEAARRTRTAEFAKILDRSTPVTDVHHTKSTHNIWRRFDEIVDPPAGFVAVGDAVCAFNPIYAQGMSSAAVTAVMLRDQMREHDPASAALPRSFYAKQAEFLKTPWALALTRDGGYEHATGTEVMPAGIRRTLLRRYTWAGFEFVTAAGWENRAVDDKFTEVFNIQASMGDFVKDPRVLLGMVGHVAKVLLRRTARPTPLPPGAEPSPEDFTHTRYAGVQEGAAPARTTTAVAADVA